VKKKLLLPIFFATFVLAFLTGYFTSMFSKIFIKKVPTSQEESPPITLTDKALDILLIGYGGPGHDGGTLSDTLIVVHADFENKKITFISVPRDLWAPIPYDWDNLQNYKINMAHAIGVDDVRYANKKPEFRGEVGGGNMAKHVVGQVTGLTIENFVSVNFEGVVKIIDLLGGAEVDVPVAFDDYLYPVKGRENETCGFSGEEIADFHAKYTGFDLEKQFTCRYEHLHFDKGKVTMNGETALKFVRSRHSAEHGGDFARSERQYALLTGIKNKAVSLEAAKKLTGLLEEISGSVRTDLTLEQITSFRGLLTKESEYKVSSIYLTEQNVLNSGRSSDGQFILAPKEGINKWGKIQEFIATELAK